MSLLIRNFTREKINTSFFEKIAEDFFYLEKINPNFEVSLVFTGEKRIRKINKEYRNIDKVTDVISFEGDYNLKNKKNIKDAYLGEIFICVSKAKRQALLNKHSLKKELSILFIHGLYHIIGYDHIKDDEYLKMKDKEDKLFNFFYNN